MSFLNPWMLLAGLFVVVPIAIHWWVRRPNPPNVVVLPTWTFLPELAEITHKTPQRKMDQPWLLLLRCLILLFLAIAMSRLSCEGPSLFLDLPIIGRDTSIVYLVDNSSSTLSFNRREDRRLNLELIEEKFRDVVKSSAIGVDKHVLFTSKGPLDCDVLRKKGLLVGDDVILSPNMEVIEVKRSLEEALTCMRAHSKSRQKLVVITDGYQGGDRNPLQFSAVDKNCSSDHCEEIEVTIHKVGDSIDHNARITRVVGRKEGDNRWNFVISAEIPAKTEGRVELYVNQVLRSKRDITPSEQIVREYSFSFEGEKSAEVAAFRLVVDGDPYPIDNLYLFQLTDAINRNLLIINGEPSTSPQKDELFFLSKAIGNFDSDDSSVLHYRTTFLSPYTFESELKKGSSAIDLEHFDAIILANIPPLSKGTTDKIEAFVQNGGGLLITAGSNVDARLYNERFETLLPRLIRDRNQLSSPSEVNHKAKNPVFAEFTMPNNVNKVLYPTGLVKLTNKNYLRDNFSAAGGDAPRLFSYIPVEPSSKMDSDLLLNYSFGVPALLGKRLGRGYTAFFTTSIDNDWNELPFSPLYLPLVRESLRYVLGVSSIQSEELTPGESVPIRFVVSREEVGKGEVVAGMVIRKEGVYDWMLPEEVRNYIQKVRLNNTRFSVEVREGKIEGDYEFVPQLPGLYEVGLIDKNGKLLHLLSDKQFVVESQWAESNFNALRFEDLSLREVEQVSRPLSRDRYDGSMVVWYLLLCLVTVEGIWVIVKKRP